MARVFTCGFESQSVTAGVEIQTVTGAPTISTTVHRAGAAALRCNPAAATAYGENQLDSGTVKRTFHRFYLRITTLPSAECTIYAIGQSGYFPGLLRLTTSGTLQLRDGFTSANIGPASAALSTGVWYRIELDYTDTAGTAGSVTGAFRGYIDGAQFADTLCSNINGWSRVRYGIQTAVTGEVHIDDVAVNDTSGSVQNGLPGPGSVVHLVPNAAGDANAFSTVVGGTAGAANNYTRVAEITPDDATSYNATVATGTTTVDDYNLSSPATAGIGANDTITLVQVGARIGSNAATAASLVYRLKSQAAGTTSESASVSVALNGWASHKAAAPYIPQLTSYTDPQSGTAWTRATLDTAQIGVRSNVSQTTARRVSAMWALVEYVPRNIQALPTVTETSTARDLTRLSGDGLNAISDGFDDGTIDPVWEDTYGGPVETGGRARVPCAVGTYAAYASAPAYRLRESSVHCRLYPPADAGATDEAWAQLLIASPLAGTDVIMEVNAATGNLVMASRVGYTDGALVALTYNATAHAWIRVRETGGQILWDTSPDGTTWTNRRTATSPAWVGDPTAQLQLISHRDTGIDDYAEFDFLNTAAGSTQPLPTVAETATVRPLTGHKTMALPTVTETTSARQLIGQRTAVLPTASETATARQPAGHKSNPVATVLESSSARVLTAAKTAAAPTVSETATVQPLSGHRHTSLPTVLETATAHEATAHKTAPLPTALETTAVQLLTPAGGLPTATETATARPLIAHKTTALPTVHEISSARPLSPAKVRPLAPVAETAAAQVLGGRKGRALPVAHETCTALPLLLQHDTDTPVDELTTGSPRTGWTAGHVPHTRWAAGTPRI
ncbi:hypothetical protein [Streptomyces fructofermentans]|uniref:Uncharacterized protein n=1 Tax=Streptomyces fructofermentans TaxID=152141 RepID=A0A918NV30_9ACTN|nr:hypothetical protein [Streptomyces fructofermentans]GGX98459.1 hypothetical protein GCM10010515_75820 [Streptomyces fructofermentans]